MRTQEELKYTNNEQKTNRRDSNEYYHGNRLVMGNRTIERET